MMHFDKERLKPTAPRFRVYINGSPCQWYVDTEKEAREYIRTTKLADKRMHREPYTYTFKREGE